MHVTERERIILGLLKQNGFISFRDLEKQLDTSPATLRRDLTRLANEGQVDRVRGGVRLREQNKDATDETSDHLSGIPFHENIGRMQQQKEAIGRAAAGLCVAGSAIMIDGGSTTLQMCRHLQGLNLQVLTNSLHIVSALLPQDGTRILLPGGSVFREQNIVLSAVGDDLMPRFHAPQLFMGTAVIGPKGVMQADIVLVAAERRLIEHAEELILLVDSSKFQGSSGNVVCDLEKIDAVVTDSGIRPCDIELLENAGIKIHIAN